ncbi:MAG: flippase [Syntrophales bacterium]|nr:flippase [Syntrophales bacterium]MDD5533426.1 flippase [Syntrophales bacterium]
MTLPLTSGKLLARNTVFNILGTTAPLLVTVFFLPFLISSFGIDRFGVLALVWVIIGYFSLFDLGLGRALTQMVAERLGAGDQDGIPSLVWVCLALMAVLGVFGAVVLGLMSNWLIYDVLKIPPELREESLSAFILLSLSLPIVISTAALRGMLEAKQRFGLINALRVPLAVFMYIGPILVLPFSVSLFHVVAVLVFGRILAWSVHLVFCFRVFPSLKRKPRLKLRNAGPLFRLGGYITVSNLISPLLAYLDRFLIGSLISVTAVAYYTTPYEIASKLWIFPGALVGVLFPAFSTCFKSDHERARLLFLKGVKYIFIALFPFVLLITAFSYEGIEFWLGSDFARNSGRVMQYMALGVFLNSFALVPFALIQAAGRPAWTAVLHFIELPFYLAAIWILTSHYGIEGAAIAWLGRVAVDTLVLFLLSRRLLMPGFAGAERNPMMIIIPSLAMLGLSYADADMGLKIAGAAIMIPLFAAVSWLVLLDQGERRFICGRIPGIQAMSGLGGAKLRAWLEDK